MKTIHGAIACIMVCVVSVQACLPNEPSGDSIPILPIHATQPKQPVPPLTPHTPTPADDPYSEVPGEDREIADSVRLCIGDGPTLQKIVVRRTSIDTLNHITGASESGSGYNGAEVLWVIAYIARGVAPGSSSGRSADPASDVATSIAARAAMPYPAFAPTTIVSKPETLLGADELALTMGICSIVAESGRMTSHSVFPPQVADELFEEIRALPTVQHP